MAYCTWKSYKLKLSPSEIFTALRDQKNCFFLDSSLNSGTSGRYSILGINPFYLFKTKNQEPFVRLRQLLDEYRLEDQSGLPFAGGAVGFLSYDLGFLLEEKLKKINKIDPGIPDCFFGFYNTALVIDNLKKILYICAVGFPEKKQHLAEALARSNIERIEQLLSKAKPQQQKEPKGLNVELKSNFKRSDYLGTVKKVKQYIKEGDIYQLNLSQCFEASTALSGREIYGRLRKISPSYFGAYFDGGDFEILSSSPERFLKLDNKRVATHPMKGTRRRGINKNEDQLLKKQLLDSPKDKAELMMIVDLERNDLGKVCDYQSIRVRALRDLERYSTVYQTTATIEGQLYKNKDRIDLLRATFPGGSITGCPKIRAMEIIEELEPHRRCVYTGALGYLSFSGGMDFNILIRSILKKQDKLYFGVGGGIVADSEPEAEYEETLVKAKAMIEAINGFRFI